MELTLYFPGGEKANAADPVLNLVEQKSRRRTLIATKGKGGRILVLRFDIRRQGHNETVFFDI